MNETFPNAPYVVTNFVLGRPEVPIQGANGVLVGQVQAYPGKERIAALWAAAPELYEALNALLHATMYRDHPTESEMAKRALAKASGPADERPPQAPTGESNAAD